MRLFMMETSMSRKETFLERGETSQRSWPNRDKSAAKLLKWVQDSDSGHVGHAQMPKMSSIKRRCRRPRREVACVGRILSISCTLK